MNQAGLFQVMIKFDQRAAEIFDCDSRLEIETTQHVKHFVTRLIVCSISRQPAGGLLHTTGDVTVDYGLLSVLPY